MMRARSLLSAPAVVLVAALGCGGQVASADSQPESSEREDVGDGVGSTAPASPPASGPEATPPPLTPTPPDPDTSTRTSVASKVDAAWVGVDETHVYFASFSALARVPKLGGAVEELTPQTFMYAGDEIALSPTSIFFAQGMGIARMPKEGGTPATLIPALASYAGAIAADGAGYFAQTGELIIRGDEGQPYTTEEVHGSGLRKVAMDEDWVYFRRPTPGHVESLVRAPRRGGAACAYDVLVDDVGVYGFVAVDSERVYFSRNVGTASSIAQISSVPKAPGGSTATLATFAGGLGGGIVDDAWVYWTQNERVYAVRKDGSAAPIALGTEATGHSPATDGARVYWSGRDGSIYATDVPKGP